MNHTTHTTRVGGTTAAEQPVGAGLRSLLVAGLTSLVVACGGGGGSSGSDPTTTPTGDGTDGATSGTGSVDVTVGDAPSDDYDEILLTVSEVRLLGGDDDEDGADDETGGDGEGSGPGVVVSEETVTVDLLALDAMTELLVASDDVPAGEYSKIRLQVDSIVANVLDADGNVTSSDEVTVVANGKVDLNPQGPFTLEDGGEITVQIDIDARESVKLTAAGQSGMILFRPVVFVDVITPGSGEGRITFLSGDVTLLTGEDGDTAFDLCAIQPLSGASDRDGTECERVAFDASTAVFDTDGSVIDFGAIEDASPVVVAGRFGTDADDASVFEALMIDAVDLDTFAMEPGLATAAASEGIFPFDPEDVDGTDTVDVTLAAGALIFDDEGTVLDASALVADAEVRVFGLEETDEGGAVTGYLASAVSVDTEDEGDAEIEGTVASVDGDTVQVTVDAAEPDVCVLVGEETDITVFVETADSAESRPGTPDDLVEGAEVDVTGTEDAEGCVAATNIVVEREG